MQPSEQLTRFGKCVYLTNSREYAEGAALRHDKLEGGAVVTVEVDLGNMRNCYDNDIAQAGTDPAFWVNKPADPVDGTQPPYDSGYASHPPWPGVIEPVFREFFVVDPSRCRVVSIDPVSRI